MQTNKRKLKENKKKSSFNSWDFRALSFFVLVTGFVNIFVLVDLLGDPRFNFSSTARMGISLAALIMAVIICYVELRKSLWSYNDE